MQESHGAAKASRTNSVWYKLLGTSAAIFLIWVGVTTALQTTELTELSDRIRGLENNVSSLASRINPAGLKHSLQTSSESQLLSREDAKNTSLQLVPHPVYYNVLTLPLMQPNVSAEVDEAQLEKRYLWWVLGGLFKTAETGVAIQQLAHSCKSWAKNGNGQTSASTKLGCVYGAISTLVTVAGAAYVGANSAAAIGIALTVINGVTKRDEATMQEHTRLLTEYQTAMVNYTGLAMTPMFSMNGDLMVHNRSGMPLMFGYNGQGDGMIFAHQFHPNTNASYMAYGFVPPPSATGKRDTYFNEEDFTSGGLESGYTYNQNSDGGYLSTQNDYGQMVHEVSCTYAGLGDNSLEFQIYDNNHDGTIAAGNVRAYQSGYYDLGELQDPVYGMPEQPGCQVARV